ncbi:MAG: zinc ribbon domain-containing protein, partial [Candidatus Thorarchaeota archaeon]
MSKNYCINCGNELEMTDRFCHKCGASVEVTKLHEAPVEKVNFERRTISEKKEKESRKPVKISKTIIISIIIIGIIAMPFVVISILGSIHLPLGTMNYYVPNSGTTNIDLNIYNDVGSVTIVYDNTITNLLEATVEVRGGIGASFDDAKEFVDNTISDTIIVDFDSEQSFYNFF